MTRFVLFSDDVEGAAAAKSKKSSQKKDVKRLPSANTSDDIDKMKVSTATLILLNLNPFVVCIVICICTFVACIVNNMNPLNLTEHEIPIAHKR